MKINQLPAMFLQGERIRLAKPESGRAAEMYALIKNFNKEHDCFLPWVKQINKPEDVYQSMETARHNHLNDQEEYRFLIITLSDDKLVGCISLFIRQPLIPYYEIGYWIATGAMGKGLATEACALVRNIARDFFKAKRLEISMAGRNKRSARVALKCGFYPEATLSSHRLDSYGYPDDTCIWIYPDAIQKPDVNR